MTASVLNWACVGAASGCNKPWCGGCGTTEVAENKASEGLVGKALRFGLLATALAVLQPSIWNCGCATECGRLAAP